MQVIKRDGDKVDFNKTRISDAIMASMDDTIGGIDYTAANDITERVTQTILDSKASSITVEAIQDIVERELMNSDFKDAAKQYILYRERRRFERGDDEEGLLTKEFLRKYKHKKPPMPPIGEFVYYRTYSRWLPDKKRREEWWETVKRAVEYNCGLIPTKREEAEKLFDDMFNLRQFLAGRTLYTGGTEVSQKVVSSNFNCSHCIADEYESLSDLFFLLLCGSGVGIRLLKEDVAKLPEMKTNIEIVHKAYSTIKPELRKDKTSLVFHDDNTTVTIVVGDSKEGWVQSLDYFFKLHYHKLYFGIKRIIIDYDNVRPKGEPLKTFGGRASGHTSIQNMFEKIRKVICNEGLIQESTMVKLRPIHILDIANIIAENVVVGGVNFLPRENRMNCWKP